jgi:rubrerythrin
MNINIKRSLNDILRNILLSHVVVKELPGNNNNNTIIRIHLIPLKSKDLKNLIKYKRNTHVSHLLSYKKITNSILSNNLNVCSICYENYKVGEYFRELPICKHIFHKKCIDKWFYKDINNMKCPICRTFHNKEAIGKYNSIIS